MSPRGHAAAALCARQPTRGETRTRLYRNGSLEVEGFAIAEIGELLRQEGVTIWLDLHDPDDADLAVLTDEFGLHPLAVEDAVERPAPLHLAGQDPPRACVLRGRAEPDPAAQLLARPPLDRTRTSHLARLELALAG